MVRKRIMLNLLSCVPSDDPNGNGDLGSLEAFIQTFIRQNAVSCVNELSMESGYVSRTAAVRTYGTDPRKARDLPNVLQRTAVCGFDGEKSSSPSLRLSGATGSCTVCDLNWMPPPPLGDALLERAVVHATRDEAEGDSYVRSRTNQRLCPTSARRYRAGGRGAHPETPLPCSYAHHQRTAV